LDFTDRLDQLEPNSRMVRSWMLSSGMRLSFVFAMKSHLGLLGMEKEILILMLKGASDRDISDQLLISIHTVKDYGKSIRSKYQVKSRLQLISALLGRSQEPAASVSLAR